MLSRLLTKLIKDLLQRTLRRAAKKGRRQLEILAGMNICGQTKLIALMLICICGLASCGSNESPDGTWDLILLNYDYQSDPKKKLSFNEDGTFNGWIYGYQGVVYATGTWVDTHQRRELDGRWVISLKVSTKNGEPAEFDMSVYMSNDFMLDEWHGGEITAKYERSREK